MTWFADGAASWGAAVPLKEGDSLPFYQWTAGSLLDQVDPATAWQPQARVMTLQLAGEEVVAGGGAAGVSAVSSGRSQRAQVASRAGGGTKGWLVEACGDPAVHVVVTAEKDQVFAYAVDQTAGLTLNALGSASVPGESDTPALAWARADGSTGLLVLRKGTPASLVTRFRVTTAGLAEEASVTVDGLEVKNSGALAWGPDGLRAAVPTSQGAIVVLRAEETPLTWEMVPLEVEAVKVGGVVAVVGNGQEPTWIAGMENGAVYAVRGATVLPGFPVQLGTPLKHPPALVASGADGMAAVFVGGDATGWSIHRLELELPRSGLTVSWPEYQADRRNSGCLPLP
ncbi:MAG: hypothetical protein HY904_06435 [Deltaproteobacteria bacterium]|nr:hypothetical protein [Deltaproteobacteria bacterium]